MIGTKEEYLQYIKYLNENINSNVDDWIFSCVVKAYIDKEDYLKDLKWEEDKNFVIIMRKLFEEYEGDPCYFYKYCLDKKEEIETIHEWDELMSLDFID